MEGHSHSVQKKKKVAGWRWLGVSTDWKWSARSLARARSRARGSVARIGSRDGAPRGMLGCRRARRRSKGEKKKLKLWPRPLESYHVCALGACAVRALALSDGALIAEDETAAWKKSVGRGRARAAPAARTERSARGRGRGGQGPAAGASAPDRTRSASLATAGGGAHARDGPCSGGAPAPKAAMTARAVRPNRPRESSWRSGLVARRSQQLRHPRRAAGPRGRRRARWCVSACCAQGDPPRLPAVLLSTRSAAVRVG